MEGKSTCHLNAAQRPARPLSLFVGSRVHVIPKGHLWASTHEAVPGAISRQLRFNAGRAQGQARHGQYGASPLRDDPAQVPSPSVREDTSKCPLLPSDAEQICPEPQTPHRDQYEHLYHTFEARQKRELFLQSRSSCKSTHAGSSYWAPGLTQGWREQESTGHNHFNGRVTVTTYARQELSSRSVSSPCPEYPCEATGKVNSVEDLGTHQSPGPAASADEENTGPRRSIHKSGTREFQRASPHASENTYANAQSPVSQVAPVPRSLLQMMPKLRGELASLGESWTSFLGAWRALLRDRRSANDRTWPTLLQVLGKLTEQVLSPDYSDQGADILGESDISGTPYSPTPGQRGDQPNSTDETLNYVMPDPSSSSSERKFVHLNTDSNSPGEHCNFRSSSESKSSSVHDVEEVFRKSVESTNAPVKSQEMGLRSSYRKDTECTELPCDMFLAHSDHHSPNLTHGLSTTLHHNQESSERKEYQALLLNEPLREHSPLDVMEWPSSYQGTPVEIVDESSEEESFGCDEVLKPEYSFREKASPSIWVEKAACKPISPATCSPAFERLPWRPLEQSGNVLQQKLPARETVSASITRTSLALQQSVNVKTPSTALPGSRTNWPSPQQNLCQQQLTPDQMLDSMATEIIDSQTLNKWRHKKQGSIVQDLTATKVTLPERRENAQFA